jgi:signal transduction histidine kinase
LSSLHALFGRDADLAEPLEAGADQRVEQLLALNNAAIAITSELELDSLLQRIVDVARELVGCKYAALGVLGDDGFITRFPTSGLSDIDREKIGDPPHGHGLLGVMLRAGRTLRIPDIAADPRRSGFPPHHPKMTGLLGVPIFVRGKLAGDLYLTDKIGGPEFGEEDEWLVQLLATHAATALTNAQLHAENISALASASKERGRTQALLRVSQAVNRSVRLDEVIPLILRSAVDLLGAAGAAVFLIEQEPESLTAEGAKYVAARYAIGLRDVPHTAQLPVENSIAGRVMATGQTQVLPDTSTEPTVVFPALMRGTLRSLVVVPLRVSDLKLGALSVYSSTLDGFDSDAVELVEAFAAQASAALYNAQLYDEAQRGRRAAEQEQERLRELEHMKDEFLSTSAHELRTPLTTIRMSAGLAHEQLVTQAQTGSVDPRLIDLIGLIVESSSRMQSLVNDLLDLTRLEQGRATLEMEEIDLRDTVRASITATRPLFDSKNQQLVVHLPEVYCGVIGDAPRLEQVVINLLSNAHKYSPPDSLVEVRVVRSGSTCRVTVRDNGPGVPPEEAEHIFERFYRSSVHRQDRTASTGLGLPIARTIAELHKGQLWVETAPEGGSIFILSLPVAVIQEPQA